MLKAFAQGEPERDHGEQGQGHRPEMAQRLEHGGSGVGGSIRGDKDHEPGPDQKPGDQIDPGGQFEDEFINGVELRPDEVPPRKKASGHDKRAPPLFEKRGKILFLDLPAKLVLPILDLLPDILGELGDDVAFLVLGQPETDGVQIAFNEIHGSTPSRWCSARP